MRSRYVLIRICTVVGEVEQEQCRGWRRAIDQLLSFELIRQNDSLYYPALKTSREGVVSQVYG